ncbi:MAG: LacI family DNA-binding transcriptional regulator [Chloroflexi bacterium]|nr:LacI family DNA-binding transcriptional regulator [Chloroflexota bacterium]
MTRQPVPKSTAPLADGVHADALSAAGVLARPSTILDVAREAGVSKATVSLVLNGRSGTLRISDVTRAAVLAAAVRLNYTPNHAARSLRSRRTGAIMLVVSRIANPYYGEIATAALKAARARGYQLDVAEAGTADDEVIALANLRSGRVDGVVVATARPAGDGDQQQTLRVAARRDLSQRGLPIVVLLSGSPAPTIPAIRIDDEDGAYLATRHLLDLGHRRIGHVSYGKLPPSTAEYAASADRFRGYLRALDEHGLRPDDSWLIGDARAMRGGRDAASEWLARPGPRPTAMFAATDTTAIGLLRGFHDLGVRVPDDVAIVGFDGVEVGVYSVPALTTIEHPRDDLGRIGVEALLDAIEGAADGTSPVAVERVLPVRLVVRESCGAAPQKPVASPLTPPVPPSGQGGSPLSVE